MTTLINNVKFYVQLDVENDVMNVFDNTTDREASDKALLKVTYLTDGTILHQASDWNTALPESWVAPDMTGAIWSVEDIGLPSGGVNGRYKVEMKYYDGTNLYNVERTFTIAYTAPTVEIDIQALCSTSQLISDDITEYDITHNGNDITPTIIRTHTVQKPAGSGANAPSDTTDKTRIIGGGSTDATRLWTKTWQTYIESELIYHLSDWSSTTANLYLLDTVSGHDHLDVTCDATLCSLAQCYYNLYDRWKASLNANFNYRETYRDTVIQAEALFIKLQLQERCGASTTQTILDLQELLSGYDCTCTSNDDAASQVVIPWAAITGSSSSASTFAFHMDSGVPNALDGNDGDVYLNTSTSDLYQKASGAWTLKVNIAGADGSDGSATNKVSVLVSVSELSCATGANTDTTDVCYPFEDMNADLFAYAGDYLMFEWEVQLGVNDNGKTLTVKYDDDNVFEWFFDDEVVTGVNDIVTVTMKVIYVNNLQQHLTAWLTRDGEVYGPYSVRNQICDLTSDVTVSLRGTNSVASAGDISGLSTVVKRYLRDTDIIPGGTGASDGRGLVSQLFTATEGQTTFVVTDFTANSFYIPIIDGNIQSQSVVTRSGQTFTYSPGLTEGQQLLIVN